MSMVVTSFSNVLVSTTEILIDQVHKFQNSYFKEHPRKTAAVLQKAYCLRRAV